MWLHISIDSSYPCVLHGGTTIHEAGPAIEACESKLKRNGRSGGSARAGRGRDCMGKKAGTRASSGDLDSIREVSNLINRLRLITRIIYGALGASYTWLLLRDLPFSEIINGSDPSVILQVTLIFMYLSWVSGLTVDFNVQALVYISDPRRGEVSKAVYFNAAVLFIAAMVLLGVRKNPRYFAAALTVFSLSCLWSLVAASRGASGIIEQSKAICERNSDWFGKEQLEIVKQYMTGRWLWIRQIVLLATLALVDVICWVDLVPKTAASWIHFWKPAFAEHSVAALIPTSSLISFLVIAETWQWYMRLNTTLSVTALGLLKPNYTIKRRKKKASVSIQPGVHESAMIKVALLRIGDILTRLKAKIRSYVGYRKSNQ
jgi:hypothetical protein